MQKITISGMRIEYGTRSARTKIGMNAVLRISSMALATYCEAICPHTKSGFFSKSSCARRGGVVGRPGPGHAFDGAVTELLGMARELLLHRVGEERRDRGTRARQHADAEAEHGAAHDRPARARPV